MPNPSVLLSPEPKEKLLLYIAYRPRAIGSVLTVECTNPDETLKVQPPINYVSEVLHGPKEHYRQVDKML